MAAAPALRAQDAAPLASNEDFGFLGVTMGHVNGRVIREMNLKPEDREGVVALDVIEGSPAAQAGLRPGDLIRSVNGEPVRQPHELLKAIGLRAPGDEVDIDFLRRAEDGRPASEPGRLRVALARREDGVNVREAIERIESGQPPPTPLPPTPTPEPYGVDPLAVGGLSVGPGREGERAGLRVFAVSPNSEAAMAGFFAGDLVYEINGRPVPSRESLLEALREAGENLPVEARFLHEGQPRRVFWAPDLNAPTPTPDAPPFAPAPR